MSKYLIVGLGGALGAIARYWLGSLFPVEAGGFPTGTFIINLSGSFGLGLFLTLIADYYEVRIEWRWFFASGFLGAYTTFSSFTSENLSLFRQGYVIQALIYSTVSLVGGMLWVWLGYRLACWIGKSRKIRAK